MPRVSILVPAYNERPTLLTVLCQLAALDLSGLGLEKEVVLVDDGSDDGTEEIIAGLETNGILTDGLSRRGLDPALARSLDIVVIRHPRNQGKSSALRSAIARCTGDFVVVQDADLEYDPNDLPRVLGPLVQGRADVVYGSRFVGSERRAFYYWHAVGNKVVTTLANMVSDLALTDVETGCKAFRADVLRSLRLDAEGFGFEVEVTVKLSRLRLRIYEVPITYRGRSYERGKKLTWRDGLRAIGTIARARTTSDLMDGPVLEETLQKLRSLRALNQAIYEALQPWFGRCVIEAGAGQGNITEYLVGLPSIIATDVEDQNVRRLREQFDGYDNVQVARWDMTERFTAPVNGHRPDTVVAVNVLEHIEDESTALRNVREVLAASGGSLVLLVPAHQSLFGPFDELFGHYRRYSKQTLTAALEQNGYEVVHLAWFNLLGVPGWWYNAKVAKTDRFRSSQLFAYDIAARFWLPVEQRIDLPTGLSLIAVARPTPTASRESRNGG